MKRKNIISLSVAFAFLALSITGLLIFAKQDPHFVKITHTIFGLIFVGFAIFHILNNWSSIVGYSKDKKAGKFQKELVIAAAVFGVVLIGSVTEVLEPIAEAGSIFAGKRPPRTEKLSFDKIETNKDVKGTSLSLMIQKGKDVDFPVMAAWVEDANHAFVESLFVPKDIAVVGEDEEAMREAKFDGEFERKPFSADLLPTFKSKTKEAKANFDKITPTENFVLTTNTTATGIFTVYIEVKNNAKTELYEAQVDALKGEVFKLKSKEGVLLANGLVEVK